jgi:uncharacterized membrane protein YoaK (UPF0700 family)
MLWRWAVAQLIALLAPALPMAFSVASPTRVIFVSLSACCGALTGSWSVLMNAAVPSMPFTGT